jgi:CubicO group peptidase (beta-lactamase class C family)
MTAMGLVKLLDKKNISLDALINPYLPSYWQRGPGFAPRVTFRKLLNHTSGFSAGDSRCDYLYMKEQVAKLPNEAAGGFVYANVNFSIMRVLIAVIDGKLAANAYQNYPALYADGLWDVISTSYFKDYMNKEVFALAGVPTIGFSPAVGGPTAKAYDSNSDATGRDGDWSTVAGGAGFYMSVAQVLKTLDAFRNNKIILPTAANPNRAQYMLDNSLGINGAFSTLAGNVYFRKGDWIVDGKEEQTAIYGLPNNVNLAVFVNSPTAYLNANGFTNAHVHGLIKLAILASIH